MDGKKAIKLPRLRISQASPVRNEDPGNPAPTVEEPSDRRLRRLEQQNTTLQQELNALKAELKQVRQELKLVRDDLQRLVESREG